MYLMMCAKEDKGGEMMKDNCNKNCSNCNGTELPNISDTKEINIGYSYAYKTDCVGDRYIKAEEVKYLLKCERNKAIDDFTGKIKENISESLIWGMIADCFKYENMNDTSDKIVDYVINTANEIAERLKVGGENEN